MVKIRLDIMETMDRIIDGYITLHRRGYSTNILQVMKDMKLTPRELQSLDIVKLSCDPLQIYTDLGWNNGYA